MSVGRVGKQPFDHFLIFQPYPQSECSWNLKPERDNEVSVVYDPRVLKVVFCGEV